MSTEEMKCIPEDDEAFEAFFRQHQKACRAYIWRRCRPTRDSWRMSADEYDELVDSAVYYAFHVAQRQRDSYDPSRSRPLTWLTTIATRMLLRHLRRHLALRRVEVPLTHSNAPAVQPSDGMVFFDAVHSVTRRVAPRQSQALHLHYVEGLSEREVAAIMQVSVEAVHAMLQRGRFAFRQHWMKDEETSR